MLQRVKSKIKSSVSGRMMFIYAVVLFAFFGISSTACALDFKIYVEIQSTGEVLELIVNHETKIRDVILVIKNKYQLSLGKLHLFFNGKELVVDSKRLMNCGISDGAMLVLKTDADSYPPAPEPTTVPDYEETMPVYEEPVFYALPEDEVGAYTIRQDGTKEYLLFHTYDICMDWLASNELCSGFERCFHKDGK